MLWITESWVSVQRVIFQCLKNDVCWYSLISSAHCSQSDAIWKGLCNHPSAILPVLLAWNISRTLLNTSCQIQGKFGRLEIQTCHWTTTALLWAVIHLWWIYRVQKLSQDKEVTSEFLPVSSYIHYFRGSVIVLGSKAQGNGQHFLFLLRTL